GFGASAETEGPSVEDGLGRPEDRLGFAPAFERVAALLAPLAQVRGGQRGEAALGGAPGGEPTGVLALVVGGGGRALEEDLAACAAAVAVALALGEQGVGVLAQDVRLDEAPNLSARLEGHQRPICHSHPSSDQRGIPILFAIPSGRKRLTAKNMAVL